MLLQTVYNALCCHAAQATGHTTFQKLTRCGMVGVESQDFGHLLTRLGESPYSA